MLILRADGLQIRPNAMQVFNPIKRIANANIKCGRIANPPERVNADGLQIRTNAKIRPNAKIHPDARTRERENRPGREGLSFFVA